MSTRPVTPVGAWATLVALALPLVALSVDLNGVAVLLPEIASDLDVDLVRAGAVVTAAALGFAAPLLLVGRLTDRFGARRLLLGGVLGFAASSMICATAGSFPVLVGGRALQGVASACCFTTSLVVVDAVFDARQRPVAIGVWAAIGGIGGAAGPLVASLVASVWSWRAFFAVNLAVGAIALLALSALVPRAGGDRGRSVSVARLGVLAVGVAFASAALQRAASTNWDPATIGAIAAGGLLVAVAWRHGSDPVVPRVVTAARRFRVGTVVASSSNWGSGVALTFVPPALIASRGADVVETGAVFCAFSIPFAIGGAVSGPIVRAWGGRGAVAVWSAVQAAGLVALATVGLDAPLPALVIALGIAGLGNGVVYSAATTVALTDIADADAGEATGLLTMWRLLGLTVGVAVSSAVITAVDDDLSRSGIDVALVVAGAVVAAGAAIAAIARAGGSVDSS